MIKLVKGVDAILNGCIFALLVLQNGDLFLCSVSCYMLEALHNPVWFKSWENKWMDWMNSKSYVAQNLRYVA